MPASADYLTQLFGLEGDVAFITGGGGASGLSTGHILAVDGGWLAW